LELTYVERLDDIDRRVRSLSATETVHSLEVFVERRDRQQPERSVPEHQRGLRLPVKRRPTGERVLDGLLGDRQRLDEEAPLGERGRNLHQKLRRTGEVFGHESVRADDTALVIPAVRCHIGLAAGEVLVRAVRWSPDRGHDHVTDLERRVVRVLDDPDRLVT